jgi:alanyl-tRNA synthetase
MQASEIRQGFLDFFQSKEHTIVPSAPVVPKDDPTLLFTNAGMNQFKDVFLGTGQRPYKRAADTQKCIRAGGKHNDLDAVGKDGYHQTFFEMLGNWSFGDYFKREAIEWAWELLVDRWGIDVERLYATVHHTDDEARKLWTEVTAIAPERVLTFGDKDNFWEMGDTGPCGPCTEIHIDRGVGTCDLTDRPGHRCEVNAGCARFIELWNLVFIQYERKPDRSLVELPAKHVDTGAGLERLAQVLQGKFSNYDTDVFTPLIEAVVERTGKPYDQGPAGTPHRAIVDHLRCLAFAIADGATPDRTGRGYVLRRILRRASRFFDALGVSEPALKDLVPALVEHMGGAFPEIQAQQDLITQVIHKEEEQFLKTLGRGVKLFTEELGKLQGGERRVFPAPVMVNLYETHGFPPDLTEQMAQEQGYSVDMGEFDRIMEDLKEKNRKQGKFKVDLGKFKHAPTTCFLGYDGTEAQAKVAETGDSELVLDSTPFYAESGGQVGDTGHIVALDGRFEFEVHDTKKQGQVFVHLGEWVKGDPGQVASGAPVHAAVSSTRRDAIRRNHTATHLLHWALHEVLGKNATQKGSEVSPHRLRFDFAYGKRLGPDELQELERLINQRIVENHPLTIQEMGLDEAKDLGAMAMFGEKYGERVRVVDVGGFSVELCGGTHVARTGDIGSLKLLSESSISEGVRRVSAVTGGGAVDRSHADSFMLAQVAQELKTKPEEILERLQKLQEEIRDLRKQNKAALASALPSWDDLKRDATEVGGVKLLARAIDGADANALRAFGDAVKRQQEPFVGYFLGTDAKGKVPMVCAISDALVQRGWHSRELLKPVAGILGGGGGGKEHMSSGAGKDASKIPQALAEARKVVEAKTG